MLDACRKVTVGKPFDQSENDSTLLADFTKKVGALKDVDQATRDRLMRGRSERCKAPSSPRMAS